MKTLQYHGFAVTPDVLVTIAKQKGASFTKQELTTLFKDGLAEVTVGNVSEEKAVEIMVNFISQTAAAAKAAADEAPTQPNLTSGEVELLAAASQVSNSIAKSLVKKQPTKRKSRHA